jgi:hypothetical protein
MLMVGDEQMILRCTGCQMQSHIIRSLVCKCIGSADMLADIFGLRW